MWKWCIVFCLLWTLIGCGGQSEVSEIAEGEVKTDGLADFEERAVTTCKEGLVVEQGYCCWKGQAWTGSSCVGKPITCPADYIATDNKCDATCPEGKVRVPYENWGRCCWEGQGFSSTQQKCVGTPSSCPSMFKPVGDDCLPPISHFFETVTIPAGSFMMG